MIKHYASFEINEQEQNTMLVIFFILLINFLNFFSIKIIYLDSKSLKDYYRKPSTTFSKKISYQKTLRAIGSSIIYQNNSILKKNEKLNSEFLINFFLKRSLHVGHVWFLKNCFFFLKKSMKKMLMSCFVLKK